MYGYREVEKMRRKDRELSQSEAMEILAGGEYGILSTVGQDYPYGVPVNYIVDGHSIYIHGSSEMGKKRENIDRNRKVCFTVVGKTEVLASAFSERYESVIVLGRAEPVSGAVKEKALMAFLEKYSAEYREDGVKYFHAVKEKTSVYRIEIEQITGKAHK